jgi:RNA polymerase sigma-70 factor, ECF subfamily
MQALSPTLYWKTAIRTEAQDDDNELLRLIARGNEEAFGVLYERYQGPLYRFAWHMSGNTATAEEITQEVFMLLIRGPKRYDPEKGSLAGYLFGIARNLTRRAIERSRSSVPLSIESDEGSESVSAFDPKDEEHDILAEISQKQLVDFLRKSVLTLPEAYREVIGLCDLEQMSYTDAAVLLQCSPGTVASRLHRARAMLKSKMQTIDQGGLR